MNLLFDLTNSIIAWVKKMSVVVFGFRPEDLDHKNKPEMTTSLFSVDHEMILDDGCLLKEEMEIREETDREGKRFVVHIHRRSIDDDGSKSSYNFYKTVDTRDEPSVAISPLMTNQEIREFDAEWKAKFDKANLKK